MAEQAKIEVVVPSKFEGAGWRVKMNNNVWYSSKTRREGELEPGYTIKFTTTQQGKDTFIDKLKVVEKGAPPPKRGGGGGGFKPNPAAEKRYAEQGAREAEKWAHQLAVVEPRITWSDSRSKAIEYAALCITSGALALGAENAAKRKGILDAFVAAETKRFFDESMALGKVLPPVVMDDIESDDLDDTDDDLDTDDEDDLK